MANVGGIGNEYKTVSAVMEEKKAKENYLLDEGDDGISPYSGLASYILNEFRKNRDAKRESGIEEEILDSLRQFNGEYSPKELAIIRSEGGSELFMNITSTKSKAAKSWMADIYQSANGYTWDVDKTPVPDLPQEMEQQIKEAVDKEFNQVAEATGEGGMPVEEAATTIAEKNQLRRDVRIAISEEIAKEAQFEVDRVTKRVRDKLVEGNWDKCFLDFIDDFNIYPTAFIKGPITRKEKRVTWEAGQPVVSDAYVSSNDRVDPLDIYPSPNATTLQEGNLCEHLRYDDKGTIAALKGVKHYKEDAIDRILSEGQTGIAWFDDIDIEQQKADEEMRGSMSIYNSHTVHGLNFHGKVNTNDMKEWDSASDVFKDLPDDEWVEVEAILVGNEVIKCAINEDPLGRRPYYKASFMDRPGALWGRSLPTLMRDIQRMCNAVARALANNVAICSGPQVEVYIDRLADSGPIEAMRPMKIWQLKSDPSGAGGRAMQWHQPTCNAGELLKVYSEFELRADDVTGIPRYAYGNEKLAGAGTTSSGLAMLLESASKIIKDGIRNIDDCVIKPRIEYEFYLELLTNDDLQYSGDIRIVPRGSSVLATKAYEALRRNEFIQITANPIDQEIMGKEGRADILREMSTELGLPSSSIPSSYEMRTRLKDEKAKEEQMMKQQAEEGAGKNTQAQIQIEGQKEMHQTAQETARMKLKQDGQLKQAELELKAQDMATKIQAQQSSDAAKMQQAQVEAEQEREAVNKEIALKLRGSEGTGI